MPTGRDAGWHWSCGGVFARDNYRRCEWAAWEGAGEAMPWPCAPGSRPAVLKGVAFSALLTLGQLGRAAAPRQQPFPVALDHARRLPPAGLQDGRQLDAAGDHVLNRPDAGAVPGQGVDDVVGKPGVAAPSSCRCAAPGSGRVSAAPCRPCLRERNRSPSPMPPASSHARTS